MAKLLRLLALFLIFKPSATSAWSVVLDTASDTRMWKIKGNVFYVEEGHSLEATMSEHFPSDFPFQNFAYSTGIWIVFPKTAHCSRINNGTAIDPSCDVTSQATFKFEATAQLVSSVNVKYNFGGNATIRITGSRGAPFEETSSNKRFDKWVNTEVGLDGRMMQFDAIVNSEDGYVLVDKITVEFQTVTTTRKPTTRRPDPIPTSGQEKQHNASIFVVVLIQLLTASFIL